MLNLKNIAVEAFGWYGITAILSAYALVSFSFVEVNDILYQVLNGTGALGVVIVSLNKKAYQPAVLNIIWTLIAVVAILRII